MNLLYQFIDWAFDPSHTGPVPADEAYLAESVDMLDLERRMREIDRRSSIGPFGQNA